MESIESLNQRLIDHFGIDTSTGQPIFRIVWADDQTEMRLVATLDSGIEMLYPAVREVKKYPFIRHLYLLERLVLVPDINKEELPAVKMSYEPVWVYKSQNGEALPPIWDATKFVIDTLYAALGKKSLRKYMEDEKETSVEGKEQKIIEMQQELFGNETDVGDALAYREGVVVPNNYKKD